jgi:hypothetical protein
MNGLIAPGGENDNSDWDGIWTPRHAAMRRMDRGDPHPIHTLSFNADLRQWHFNVQRRIQRRLGNRSLGISGASIPGDADDRAACVTRSAGI